MATEPPNQGGIEAVNRRFYDSLWSGCRLVSPERFNTWPLVNALLAAAPMRLEVGPGMRPRLPIQGTHFVDISPPALACLSELGGHVHKSSISSMAFADGIFDLVCALDIIEHVEDDEEALSELARVATPGATLLISTPLHQAFWTSFDDLVGHRRRYDPETLTGRLAAHGFSIEQSAVFGMKPGSEKLVNLGMWFLTNYRPMSLWFYNRLFMPLGIRSQKKLVFQTGMIDAAGVDEIILVCRRGESENKNRNILQKATPRAQTRPESTIA